MKPKYVTKVESYRPVTLLINGGRIKTWMSEEGQVNPRQYGFMEERGTVDSLVATK